MGIFCTRQGDVKETKNTGGKSVTMRPRTKHYKDWVGWWVIFCTCTRQGDVKETEHWKKVGDYETKTKNKEHYKDWVGWWGYSVHVQGRET